MHCESEGGIWKPGGSGKSTIGGGGIACAEEVAATVRIASAVKHTFTKPAQRFTRLIVPPVVLHMHEGRSTVTLSSVLKIGITQNTLVDVARASYRLQHTRKKRNGPTKLKVSEPAIQSFT